MAVLALTSIPSLLWSEDNKERVLGARGPVSSWGWQGKRGWDEVQPAC